MFSNASVKRLLSYRKGNGSIEELSWSDKACRSLVKKLKNNQINHLEIILSSRDVHSKCIQIPRWVHHQEKAGDVLESPKRSTILDFAVHGIWSRKQRSFIFKPLNHSPSVDSQNGYFAMIIVLALPNFHIKFAFSLCGSAVFCFFRACLRLTSSLFLGSKVTWFTEINWIVFCFFFFLSTSRGSLWSALWFRSACH